MNLFRVFMELDEAYSDRQAMIDAIKKSGKNYNFAKYSDAQLYRMVQKLNTVNTNKIDIVKEPVHEFDLDFENSYNNYCDCGTKLSDAGFCPVCHDGEEDMAEGIFDVKPVNTSGWVSASGQQIKIPSNTSTTTAVQSNTQSSASKYVVRIVSHGGRLRALATDGKHPAAFVAFPNNLRQFEGQRYEVDQLIWNGKNYRVAGNIIEI